MKLKNFKKWILRTLLIILLVIAYNVIEFSNQSLWYTRTHITHPLHYAVKNDNERLTYVFSYISFFREQKFKSYIKGNCTGTPAEWAIKNKSYKSLEILLNRNVSFTGCAPLILATISKSDFEAFKILIKYGVNINERYAGKTFLHYAVSSYCDSKSPKSKIAEHLINAGLNVNERAYDEGKENFERTTPLHSALYRECINNVKLLLEHGADKNISVHGKLIPENKNYNMVMHTKFGKPTSRYNNFGELLEDIENKNK